MSSRESQIDQFLAGSPWQHAQRVPMKQDASFRRYFRLSLDVNHIFQQERVTSTNFEGPRTAILMDAPPPERPVIDFATIANHLLSLGLRAPQQYQIDNTNGFLLIEDFGNTTMTTALNDGLDETSMYALAVDELLKLHQNPSATDLNLPSYNRSILDQEAELLCDWFYPFIQKREMSLEIKTQYFSALHEAYNHLVDTTPTLVLRDYHVDNIMLVTSELDIDAPSNMADQTCALLDFQDALIGRPAYDLVSLLEDARRDLPIDLVSTMLTRYFERQEHLNHSQFMAEYHVLGVQRHCKVAGIFIRLFQRDAKSHYLAHIPRVLHLLDQGLNHAPLQELKNWFDKYLPLKQIDLACFR